MNDTRSRTVFSIVAVLALLFAFGLGALSSFVLGSRTAGQAVGNGSGPSSTVVGTSVTPGAAPRPVLTPSRDTTALMQDFYEVLDLIKQESYFRPVDEQKLIFGAIQGMMSEVGDDYTRFETPQQNANTQKEMAGDSYAGIGAYIEILDDVPTIASPIPNTPAARAGIRPRDIILRVDGRDVTQLTAEEVASLVKGPPDTKVRLTLVRGRGTPFDLEITRAVINIPQVSTEIRPDGIALLSVSIFGEKTTPQLDEGIKQAHAQNAKGIILDLRNNGGGFVTDAQKMIGRFVSPSMGQKYNDVALYYSYSRDGSNDKAAEIIRDGEQAFDLPMVVLVNGGTASASEITAGALSDYGRSILIGEQTFGKGSVQNVHQLADGSSARVTIAHWLSPSKRDINPRPSATPVPSATATPLPTFTPTPAVSPTAMPPGITPTVTAIPVKRDRGITPNIEILRTEEDFAQGRDPQMDRAVQYVLTGK
ncbi:MAG TPA: S41 family peptidase [Chloroflexia bacterium]|nr:S41 family peptidase [Chloroflexia bacterium]